MERKSLTRRVGAGRDEGSALVAVIGVMVVLTILVMTIVTTSLFNVRTTTVTRASVQAKAAAESGIDFARAQLQAGLASCGSSLHEPTGSAVHFRVAITCPTSGSIVVRSTGSAASPGIGSSDGNERTMEAGLATAASAPRFDKAVFVGTAKTKLNSSWRLNGVSTDGSSTGGYYGRGDLDCNSNGAISGPVVITGTADLNSGCKIDGDLFIQENLYKCNSSTVVNGSIYVQGSAAKADATGTKGDISCVINGSLHVANDIRQVSGSISGGVISSTGTITEWSNGNIAGGLTVTSLPPEVEAATIAGVSCSVLSWDPKEYGCTDKITIATSALPMKPADGFDEKMPVLDAQASSWPGFSWQNWSEFIRNSYVGYGVTATDAGRFAADIDTCEAWPSDANKSDGDSLNGPINSPNVPTVLDARGCNLIRFKQASTIVLNEDLTILVKDFRSSKGLQVVKGPLVPSGKTPTLRIVLPMENSATECVANAHDGVPGIRFDSGGASSGVGSTILGADVSLMLYSAGTIDISNSMSFYGQVYTCNLPDAKNDVTINFRPVGDVVGAGGPVAAGDHPLLYLRDVSGS